MKTRLLVPLVMGACVVASSAQAGTRLQAWSLAGKAGADPVKRTGWTPLGAPGTAPRGAAIENRALVAVARPGTAGVVLYGKGPGVSTRVELVLTGAGKAAALDKVELLRSDGNEVALRLSSGGARAELVLKPGSVFVEIRPLDGAGWLEVHAGARYALLPDFFADDTAYDPRRFKSDTANVPAENFLLQFVDGGNAIVMCVWPGTTGKPEKGAKNTEPRDPRVDLLFAGDGANRRITAGRIEFLGRPVCVAILARKSIWHDEPVADWPACKPRAIDWKRPFEAQWRAVLIVAEGRTSKDWHTRSQSFPVKGPGAPGEKPWWYKQKGSDQESPHVSNEGLGHFIYPCWFKGKETSVCVYANAAERRKAGVFWGMGKAKSSSPKMKFTNIYERVLIYPLDRVANTPLDIHTPVDVMRKTLGQGPCEYVLDLEGVKPRASGGSRELVAPATCNIWMEHIFPITGKIKRLKPGEKLEEKTQTHLLHSLEDMRTFVHAVHDRLRDYKKWGQEMNKFLGEESARSAGTKALAARLSVHVKGLNALTGRLKFEGKDTEDWWDKRIGEIIEQIKTGKYDGVGGVGKIRGLGARQDHDVACCRRFVKGVRQEAALADTTDPQVRKLAAKVRQMCHQVLRNKHRKEGL